MANDPPSNVPTKHLPPDAPRSTANNFLTAMSPSGLVTADRLFPVAVNLAHTPQGDQAPPLRPFAGLDFISLHRTKESEFRSQNSELTPTSLRQDLPPNIVSSQKRTRQHREVRHNALTCNA
jgi:hypothetical protein